MPKVSVITGFYNRSDMVARTLDSIRSQTFTDFECLVFDDASLDDTAAAIQTWISSANDSRFKAKLYSKNVGFVQGMIDTVADAKGDLIAVVGSGDLNSADRLLKQVAEFSKQGVSIVDSYLTNRFVATGVEVDWKYNHTDISLDQLCARNTLNHGNIMFDRSVYDQAGGYRRFFRYSQDYDLWLRMRAAGGQLRTVKEVLYTRHLNSDGVSQNPLKLLYSMRYQWFARDLALGKYEYPGDLSVREQEDVLDSLYPVSSREVQREVFRISRNWALLGNRENARAFSGYLNPGSFEAGAIAFVLAVSNPYLTRALAALRRFTR